MRQLAFLFLCFYGSVLQSFEDNYFFSFRGCCKEEFSEKICQKSLDMCWFFGEKNHFCFVSSFDEVYFEIAFCEDLPDSYDDFLKRINSKCIQGNSLQKVFSYRRKTSGIEEINHYLDKGKRQNPDDFSYIVSERREIKKAHPAKINVERLASIIKNSRVLFYTGAGLSLGSNIPAMHELHEFLGLEMGERFLFSLENAIISPKKMAEKISLFHHACFFSIPTRAHMALKEICIYKDICLITENLDCLHEATGIEPYRIDPHQLREKIGGASLALSDYIICVGLSFDDRGFLGWYKKQNPQGRIIAIDISQPSYLGDEDFWLKEDLQEAIVSIASILKEK